MDLQPVGDSFFEIHYPDALRQKAYKFNGEGKYFHKGWDLSEGTGKEFCWYHAELPNVNISQSVQCLMNSIYPPLKLVSNGPFCGHLHGALVFRVNSPGSFLFAARVTENSVITVSRGQVPRLLFFEADNPVPKSVSNLVVHIIDTHVDQLRDILTKLEIELDGMELEMVKGGFGLKKQSKRLPKMHLNLQRLLQIISYGEQVFPQVREKCSSKNWFSIEDVNALEELIARLRRLKENVRFIANRVTEIQTEQNNWRLYYLFLFSIVFLPLCIISGVVGMNVGGVPVLGQKKPNVLLICVTTLFLVLPCFLFLSLIVCWTFNWRSFLRKTQVQERDRYMKI